MKNIKILFAVTFVIGLMGITQAFACKQPTASGNGVVTKASYRTSSPGEVEYLQSSFDGDSRFYSKRDLVGRYASLATATIFDPTSNRTLSATCVGVVTFDGRGHFTDREVHSYDGVIVRDEFVGTYTVSSDGRGIMHFVGANETFDYEFVISNDVKEITFLITLDVPGVVSYGTLKKQ